MSTPSITIAAVTFDCRNAQTVGTFWAAALDRELDTNPPGISEFFARLAPAAEQPVVMFIQVPEPKAVKNRVHLDLETENRQAAVERLVSLGASVVHDKDEWGLRWTTLADPEGNEFCIAGP